MPSYELGTRLADRMLYMSPTELHTIPSEYLVRVEGEHEMKLTTDCDTAQALARMDAPYPLGQPFFSVSERTYFFPALPDGHRRSITRIAEEDGDIYFRFKNKRPGNGDNHVWARDELVTPTLEEALAQMGLPPTADMLQSPPAYKSNLARTMLVGGCLVEVAAHTLWVPAWNNTLYQTEFELKGVLPDFWTNQPDRNQETIAQALRQAYEITGRAYAGQGIGFTDEGFSKSEWMKQNMGISK